MPRWKNIIGQRFGRLVAKKFLYTTKEGDAVWLFHCDCGNEKEILAASVVNNRTKSCGCHWNQICEQFGRKKTLSVNHNFFSEWSEEMAWMLGFWAADGCIYLRKNKYPRVSFSQKEHNIIKRIKQTLGSEHKIHTYPKEDSPKFSISFSSSQMRDDIEKIFGQDSTRKSLTLNYPTISAQFESRFWLGYIDGDGSIRWDSSNLPSILIHTGSKSFAYGIQSAIHETTGIYGRINQTKDRVYKVCYSGIKAKCLALWLYREYDGICLERKKTVAEEILLWEPSFIKVTSVSSKMLGLFPQYLEKVQKRVIQ